MKSHSQNSIATGKHKCIICDEIYPTAAVLAEHKLTHCKVSIFQIIICIKKFVFPLLSEFYCPEISVYDLFTACKGLTKFYIFYLNLEISFDY